MRKQQRSNKITKEEVIKIIMNESAEFDIHVISINEKYNFSCVGCGKSYRVTAIDILKYLREHQKLYCLNCIEDKDDYRICEACKSKNPLGDITCIYCGHTETML